MQLFTCGLAPSHPTLQQFVPSHFRESMDNSGLCSGRRHDSEGNFRLRGNLPVNDGGFWMITALPNHPHNSISQCARRRFLDMHMTGTLLPTIVNDIERVQYAMSSVLAELLQQFFTLVFTAAVVVLLGGKSAWVLLLFLPFISLRC